MGERLHATCVALDGRGVLLRGVSGSGKSSVAVQMIGLGATLVADDHVLVARRGDAVIATAPPRLRGMIEVRGIGLARLDFVPETVICLVADMDRAAGQRLPDPEQVTITSRCLPLIRGKNRPYLAQELMAFLRAGQDPLFADPAQGVEQTDDS
ncbi:HPr kinase/phosphorylase [Oceanibium sediminis]|uniref:HPr kinase/phosphorylase n=1 Tax=Oceanibium sediminis TaxID=2026339 RepID=UPI000DD3CB19|nr:HPr kinase/phosphatase C-terminal domain-containing protein [Oceanibium sediminis]